MVVKPRPWVTRSSGGYLRYASQLVRTHFNAEHTAYIAAADARGHLSHVYESLDVLGSVGWRIHERVYEVMMRVWNGGVEGMPGFPTFSELDVELGKIRAVDTQDMGDAEKREHVARKRKLEVARRNAFSQRCDLNYKMEIAKAVGDFIILRACIYFLFFCIYIQFLGETIYFPHNLDFRGRAYPLPAHLNHIGNDVCRGLLVFDKAKPLGENGLRWLKIQVANLAGKDKASFSDREEFTDENLELVMDSADKPLEVLERFKKP
jgi:DNA-directed RNA polymerase, mitochondrial